MRNQTARSLVDAAREELRIQPYTVDGFKFLLDDDNSFNPNTAEAAEEAGFPHRETMPLVAGFFYQSGEYTAYLAKEYL